MRVAPWKLATGLIAAVALVASMAACTPGGKKSDSSGSLTVGAVGLTTLTDNFNIMSPTSDWWWSAGGSMVYEPLIRYTAQLGEPKGWLAKSWDFSADGKKVTLHLRDDVKFSDGSKMTSADVVYSLKLAEDPKSGKAPFYTDVSATDDDTVVLTSKKPSYGSLAGLNNYYIVPKAIWSAQSDVWTWTNPKPVGTGPAVVTKASPQKISYSVRDDYWGGKLPPKQLNWVPVSTAATLTQVERGAIDFAHGSGFPENSVDGFLRTPGTGATPVWSGGAIRATFNDTKAPFNDVNVRIALRDAMDPKQIASLEGTKDVPTNALGMSLNLGDRNPKGFRTPFKQDPKAAKAALAASGYSVVGGNLTKDGKSYPITILAYAPGIQGVSTKGAQGVAQQWETVLGVKAQVSQADPANAERIINDKSFDVYMLGSGGDSAAGAVGGIATDTDPTGFTDEKLTALVDKAADLDPESAEYAALSEEIWARLAEVVPWGVGIDANLTQFTTDRHWTGWKEAFAGLYANEAIGTEMVTFLKKLRPAAG